MGASMSEKLRGEWTALRQALQWIAHFDDTHMQTATTLHYDMRGKAREALAAAPTPPAATPVDEPKNDEREYGCYACGKQGLKKGQRISLVFCNECDDKYYETIRKARAAANAASAPVEELPEKWRQSCSLGPILKEGTLQPVDVREGILRCSDELEKALKLPSEVGEGLRELSGETAREFIVNEVTQQLGRIAKTLNGGEHEQLITHAIMPIATRAAIRAYEAALAAPASKCGERLNDFTVCTEPINHSGDHVERRKGSTTTWYRTIPAPKPAPPAEPLQLTMANSLMMCKQALHWQKVWTWWPNAQQIKTSDKSETTKGCAAQQRGSARNVQ
jgi:hypothetical protein